MVDDEVYPYTMTDDFSEGVGFTRRIGFSSSENAELLLSNIQIIYFNRNKGYISAYLYPLFDVPSSITGSHEFIFDIVEKKFYIDETSYDFPTQLTEENDGGKWLVFDVDDTILA